MPSKLYKLLKSSVRRHNGRDLTQRQLVVLGALCEEPKSVPRTVYGLAAVLELHRPAVSRAHMRLGDAGLVESVRDAVDKRSVILSATPAGRRFWADLTTGSE